MDLLQKDIPILAKIYEAKCFYDSQNNRIILYYKNHVTAQTLVDFYNLPITPPPNSSLYVIYDLQTGTFNVSIDPPIYTVSNSKVYVTSPINAEYDMDKVIIYRINGIGGYRRVDLTGATSDYELQVGEEAYYVWDTIRSISLPLRIRVSGMLYEMIVVVPNKAPYPITLVLLPNNTSYSSAFQRTTIYSSGDNALVYNWKDTPSCIFYEQVGGGGMLVSWLQTTTNNKGEMHHMTLQHDGFSLSQHMQVAHRWIDTTTVWSSLGTLVTGAPNGTLYVLVRRLA